ncbi:nucleotidyltransferase [Faecalicatena contorta]|uniref:nucleotidyltransferase family protein n=1 Tax=Faecalicatena contorta TaxID=39482 RepID=UPI001F371971|nr:sugar phosphate nucleotidyltransferase [Faecalicatena contorta]MCF2680979.1 nucleotidyltransferase [Faecalicatena contorta]
MKKATLVIMAAGIGSRFGGGIKQLEPVGPNGEIIMDYSIYDAMEAGFNKVVFVIRKDLDKDFKEVIGNRIEKVVDVAYAYQELDDIPEQFKDKLAARKKPWGTGQAILCCKDVVKEPFLVINADDYYGKESYREAYQYLTSEHMQEGKLDICMVGFVLKNTLSENGTVTRGVCKVDEHYMLTDIEETYGITRCGDHAVAEKDGYEIEIDMDSPVSMNMWGFPAFFMEQLEERFEIFLESLDICEKNEEFLLPRIIGEMLKEGKVQVKVLESWDKWFGITYKEDKAIVINTLKQLIENKMYPEKLF